MKTNKQFTIDVEIAELLKQTNASQLVNALLKEHFEVRGQKNTLLDEKTAVLSQISKKKDSFLNRLRFLKSGMRYVWMEWRANSSRARRKSLQ